MQTNGLSLTLFINYGLEECLIVRMFMYNESTNNKNN